MVSTKRHIAILVFARRAHVELKHKSFFAPIGFKKNLAVAQFLNRRIQLLAEQTGFPVFWFDEKDQRGGNFGQKLSNAVQEIFQKGFQQIIIVGNDCPTLTSNHFLVSIAAAQKGKMVIGPTMDGGAYLIGLQRASFAKDAFESLPWQNEQLLSSLQKLALQQGQEAQLLSYEIDLDAKEDIVFSFQYANKRALLAPLFSIIGWFKESINDHEELTINNIVFTSLRLRGPPQLYSSKWRCTLEFQKIFKQQILFKQS